MLDHYNVLTQSFRRVRDALQEPSNQNLRLRITGARVERDRMYELPTGTELAGLIPVTSLNPLFDSLHFPLLFPHGNDGYHNRIRYNPLHLDPEKKRKYVTQREYYCFRLQYRPNEGKTLIRGGKALQHFCIDAFTTIEQNRLTYLRLNQTKLRSDIYKGLYDAMHHGDLDARNLGSVRYMQQLYHDAMAVTHYYNNPDLFITFTCNERGLPHVHIILWLQDIYKPTTPAKVDHIISAELPDPQHDPVGYDAVTKFMLHGPCGDTHPTCPCMKNNKCSKYFPKPYASETTFDEHGHVTYRRRATAISAVKSGATLDNAFVVPYNRNLLVKYQAHMNVEICHKGQLIKYLFKYITKGPDRSESVPSIINRPGVEKTMLTEWFTLNRSSPSARKYLYSEITHAYVWDKDYSLWTPRKKGFVIGRIASVPPRTDVFYLRLLLTKIPGPLSFGDLRTVNGVLCRDYQEACQMLGLLANDDEWNAVMAEVSQWGMPPLIRSTLSKVRSQRKIALVVASSGIAATLLPGGVTAHSRFKIPIEVDHSSTCMIKKGTALAQLIQETTLIVWDEAPMVHRLSFEAVDRTICDIMNKPTTGPDYKPFGGKTVLLGGDFRQTLPVVPDGGREDNINASLTRSYLWSYCTLLELHTNMRIHQSNANKATIFSGLSFPDWVLAIGDARLPRQQPENNMPSDWITIPECFIVPPSANPIGALVDRVYPSLSNAYHDISYIRSRAIVTPTNLTAATINDYILDKLPGRAKIYLSSDSLTTPGPNQFQLDMQYPTEFLNGLSFNGMPEHQLKFKPYCIVMLLRNLNPSAGLCNGTRILLTHLASHVVRGLIVGGSFDGTVAVIPRIILDKADANWPFTLRRRQFPLKICYAMTINKSQGQTLDQVGLYLPSPVFSHGQLYVAISRVRSATGIHIVIENDASTDPNITRNIVYEEIYADLHVAAATSIDPSL
ncbi:ATP-dependent DNA helicase PIF1 [Linum grandiflorum]